MIIFIGKGVINVKASYGHFAKACKSETFYCGICAKSGHETTKCKHYNDLTFVDFKCINCIRSNCEGHAHPAFSRSCPCYLTELDKLKRSISFYNQKN